MPEPSLGEPAAADAHPPVALRQRRGRRLETLLLLAAGIVLVLLVLLARWGLPSREPAAPSPAATASAPTAAPPARASAPAVTAPASAPPFAAAAASAPLPALDESDIELTRLLDPALGHEAMALLRPTQLVRNIVATVDNLDRAHAPRAVWPVNGAAGRFVTAPLHGQLVISADNELRYTPFLLLAEGADLPALVRLYAAWYPLFQQAYVDLGYPNRQFHTRLLAVIDHLLAAPEPEGPVAVEEVRVSGATPLARPWLHMVFVDPALERLSAGQKLLVRMGAVNERRLKARLQLLRAELVKAAAPA
jgi:hypothetical protein